MRNQQQMMSSARTGTGKDYWRSPQWFVSCMDGIFHFHGDAAADKENALFPVWFGPGSPYGEDALAEEWTLDPDGDTYRWYCNPPYSIAGKFAKKAEHEALLDHAITLMLLGGRIDTKLFHDRIWHRKDPRVIHNVGVIWHPVQGRFRFTIPEKPELQEPAPFPSMVVLFYNLRHAESRMMERFKALHIHGTEGITSRNPATGIWEVIAAPPKPPKPTPQERAAALVAPLAAKLEEDPYTREYAIKPWRALEAKRAGD